MYPSVSQVSGGQLRGVTDIFNIVVDVRNCVPDFITFNETNTDFTTINTNDTLHNSCFCDSGKKTSCDTCKSDDDNNCGECYCTMHKKQENGVDALYSGKCVCNKQIRTEESCTCGDMKVAPWGSMLPVYSAKTQLLYKNPVCAACNGVTDGIVWTPVIYCDVNTFNDIDFEFDTFKICSVNFIEPKNIETSFLPRCVKKKSVCFQNEFYIPHDLGMSYEEIINACESEFNSIYMKKDHNVFCAICNEEYIHATSTCVGDSDLKASSRRLSFIMNLDFLIDKTGYKHNFLKRKRENPRACSSSVNIFWFS